MTTQEEFEAEVDPLATGAPTAPRTTRRRAHPARRTRRWVASSSVLLSGGIVGAMYLDNRPTGAVSTSTAAGAGLPSPIPAGAAFDDPTDSGAVTAIDGQPDTPIANSNAATSPGGVTDFTSAPGTDANADSDGLGDSTVGLIEPPVVPLKPSGPPRILLMTVVLVLAFGTGIVIAPGFERIGFEFIPFEVAEPLDPNDHIGVHVRFHQGGRRAGNG